MRKLLAGIFVSALTCAFALAQTNSMPTPSSAQQAQPNSAQPPSSTAPKTGAEPGNTIRIAPGSVIPVQLTKTVDAKKLKSGDEVQAKVTQDMKNGSGEILVPKDTKVLGHVTEAQARNKEQKESEVGIAFDHAVLKDGSQLSLPMSIQAIIGQQNQNGANNNGADSGASASAPSSPSTTNVGSSPNGGRPSSMGTGSSQQQMPSASTGENGAPSGNSAPPITGDTKGVVGISSLTLSSTDGAQGSVITSDKNNVKLDSGTFMLLRVSQDAGKAQ